MKKLLLLALLLLSFNSLGKDFSSYAEIKSYFDNLKIENSYFNGDFSKTNEIFLVDKELNYNISIQDRYTGTKEIFFQVYKVLNQEFVEGYCETNMFNDLKEHDVYLRVNMYDESGDQTLYKFIVTEKYCS